MKCMIGLHEVSGSVAVVVVVVEVVPDECVLETQVAGAGETGRRMRSNTRMQFRP